MNTESPELSVPVHAKHRERMKTRIIKYGANTLADYELLEALLFYSIPRRDTKPIARALLDKFNTYNALCQASPQELSEIDHIGEHSAVLFKIIHRIALILGEEKIINKTIFMSWQDVITYCRTRIGFIEKECFLVIFVDNYL